MRACESVCVRAHACVRNALTSRGDLSVVNTVLLFPLRFSRGNAALSHLPSMFSTEFLTKQFGALGDRS